jgi:hypothetical protein
MSQDEFGDESVYINTSYENEVKQPDEVAMMDMTKLSQSKTISADDLHSLMVRKVRRITEIFPFVSKVNVLV